MKTIAYFFALIAAAFALTSCEPNPIDIELPAPPAKLVISSQVIPDNYLAVSVSRSFSSLKGDQNTVEKDSAFLVGLMVEHALVVVTYDGINDTLIHLGNGVYGSERIIQQPHHSYQLYVKDSASGLSCSSNSIMLPQVTFDTVYPVIERTAAGTSVYMEYEFTDPASSGNFYAVSLHPKPKETTYEVNNLVKFTNKNSNTTLLSDVQMAERKYKGRWKLNVGAQDTIVFSLSNVSEGYYKFLTAYERSNSFFNQATGEPINYPSNIVNGYGFFNTHNPDFRVFYLAEW